MKNLPTQSTTANYIDHKLAQAILDKLNYKLQDLSIEYGDVIIPSGDIAGQLYYTSSCSSFNLMGYVWTENDLFYVSGGGNHHSLEQAALELLDSKAVQDCAVAIELFRSTQKDYF